LVSLFRLPVQVHQQRPRAAGRSTRAARRLLPTSPAGRPSSTKPVCHQRRSQPGRPTRLGTRDRPDARHGRTGRPRMTGATCSWRSSPDPDSFSRPDFSPASSRPFFANWIARGPDTNAR
jgi:hypothetical protein